MAFVAGTTALACAKGAEIPIGGAGGTSGGGASGTTSGGSGGQGGSGKIGSPCTSNAACAEGSCAPIGNHSYCTQPCPPACPDGSYCSLINGASICVPDLDQQCARCAATTDCKLPSDKCLTAPAGDSFCARDCTVDGLCPNGFTCEDAATYADAGAPSADAGTATEPERWCVPNAGYSCPCNDKRDGATRACSAQNASGTCHGTEHCDGAASAWTGCTAATPAPESCNGKDDDCNGQIDDGDPALLCAGAGEKPPHATWACTSGVCAPGACDPGWATFPAGATVCSCQMEAGEPNDTCASPTDGGSVSDAGGTITLSGTLSGASDVDVWTFQTVDSAESGTNSYHVSIAFTAPSPNDEFLFDVIRGACTDTPSGGSVGITAYDWCVNGTDGAQAGEVACGPTAPIHCNDHSSPYFLRVTRKPGATASCGAYAITVTASASGCDMTQKCM
jgi:hypothetical protein